MNQVEILTELICDRIIKKISNTCEDEFPISVRTEQKALDLIKYINVNEKEVNEIYRRTIYLISNETEFECFTCEILESLYDRFHKPIKRDLEYYYKNKELGKPWLKQNVYLNEFETFDELMADDNAEAFENLLDEVQKNYTILTNTPAGEYNLLIFLINQTITEFENDIETRSKQLEMSEEEYVRFICTKYLRVIKVKS